MYHETAKEARDAGITYHLVPAEYWEANRLGETYLPEAFATDGFIHCTNGVERLLWVANEFYTGDPREFTALVLDVNLIDSPVRYDDPNEEFPHIYGPLNTGAVVGRLSVHRDDSGAFVSISA